MAQGVAQGPTDEARALVAEAFGAGASDLHLDPWPGGVRVTMRVAGRVQPLREVGREVLEAVRAMANLPDAGDGPAAAVATAEVAGRRIRFRVVLLPTELGPALALRAMPFDAPPDVSRFGVSEASLAAVDRALDEGRGLVLVTGGVGSGKSTTLGSLVARAARPGRRTIVVGDVVDYEHEGALHVVTSARLRPGAALAVATDADPDVVAYTSVLDTPAEVAAVLATTRQGPLVLAVIDAPDAAAALHRLVHRLGADPGDLGSHLGVVFAQRLVPRADAPGRVLVYEVMEGSPGLTAALVRGEGSAGIRAAAGPDFRPMADDLAAKVAAGVVRPADAADVEPPPELTGTLDAVVSAVMAAPPPLASLPVGATVTIMFTDIVDSTPLTAALGDAAWLDVQRHHDELVRKHVADFGGSEVKSVGDGFMLVFPSAAAAVRCGLAIRDSAQAMALPGDRSLRVRVGMHAGEPVREGDDFFGVSVIVAARVNAVARPGEVLVSDLVRRLVAGSGTFRFGEERVVELKGLEGAHLLYPVEDG